VALYLVLCPAPVCALALDNAGLISGLLGWFFIRLVNAALYGGVGLELGERTERKQA